MPYWRLYYHFVWATKNREPLLVDTRLDVLIRSIQAICTEQRVIVHAVGSMPDHLHLAVSVPPRIAIADFVQQVKGTTSRRFNTTATTPDGQQFAWQPEYGVLSFSFGERSLGDVIAYIENQPSRHADQHLWPIFEQTERPYDPQPAIS